MKKNTLRIQKGFNLIAPVYDFFATLFFANLLHRAQTFHTAQLKKAKKTLIVGGGTGKILAELIKSKVSDKYHYIDISPKMIALTKKRISSMKLSSLEIVFECSPIEEAHTTTYDLIVTPFVLDSLDKDTLPLVFEKLRASLSPKGEWLFVDFHIPSGKMRFVSKAIIKILYFAFNLLCSLRVYSLPPFEKYFAKYGFTLLSEKFFLKSLLVSRVYRLG